MMDNDNTNDLVTRISWLYHMEGMRQEDISNLLGLSRSRVLRLLSQARDNGVVEIKVSASKSRCVMLERLLEKRLGLERAIVIPQPPVRETSSLIGAALGAYISDCVGKGIKIGVGWGHTLGAALSSIPQLDCPDAIVASMIGCENVRGSNTSELAWRLASRLSAECCFLTAPVFAPDQRTRESLAKHPGIQRVLSLASELDMAIVSADELSPYSTITNHLPRGGEEIAELVQQGAVGDVLGQFISVDGKILDHHLNKRIVAVHPDTLSGAKKRILAAGGWSKYAVTCGALKLVKPHVLITDEVFAVHLSAE